MSEEKIEDRVHAELMALQDLAVGDIRFYKEQEWKICNYGLLLYAAISATPKLIDSQLGMG